MPWNFRHWSVSDIDQRQTGACCACSRCGTFLFAPLLVIVLWPQISGKDSPTHAESNSRSPFPHLCTKKLYRSCCACSKAWPRGYKTFFLLNSVEHEILNAHKYKKYQDIKHFSGSDELRMLFFPLTNVKMPTIVGILTLMSMKNFMLC